MEITLPELGENIDSATVTKVLVKVGESIKKDQSVLEVDTEKASVDVPASSDGTIKEIRVKEGDVLKVGQVVLVLEASGDPATPPPLAAPEPAKVEKPKPREKAQPTESAPQVSKEELQKESGKVTPDEPSANLPEKPPEKLGEPPQGVPASPKLRRMARELGIDIHTVAGTGPEGRITEDDVRNHARSVIQNANGPHRGGSATALPDFSRWGEVERKAMSTTRRAIADHVHRAWTSIPHVTLFDSADITELETFRKNYAKENPEHKVTITAIALKVVSEALKTFPQFNASLDAEKAEIVLKKYFHIGVAVDTEYGLLVPVIRDVDKKGVLELSIELGKAAEKARSRKLSLEDMQGGTFTITNLGGIGGVNFTPIINSPEVAILGISRAKLQPVFRDGEFISRMLMPLALSMDHRVVDGAEAARFLRWVSEAFEQPIRLVLEG